MKPSLLRLWKSALLTRKNIAEMEESGPETASQRSAPRCPICKKPYSKGNNARAKSKHLSYCRKKYQSGTLLPTKRKACDECVRAKVRCNLGPGGCSRCASRAIPCTYQGTLVGLDADRSYYEADGVPHGEMGMSQHSGLLPVNITPNSPDASHTPSAETSETNDVFLGGFIWNNAFGPGWSYVSNFTTGFSEEPPLPSGYELQTNPTDSITLPDHSFQPHPSIPISLDFRNSSLFERRRFSEPEHELSGDLALHILRSYLHMLASQDCVPPFIHPKYQELSKSDTTRPSPLFAALRLVQMLLQGQRINKSLIWGLIRTEQDRLFKEHHTFHKWEGLEALQSLVIYMLLRVIEGRQEYTDFDTQLLVSTMVRRPDGDPLRRVLLTTGGEMKVMCRQLTTKYGELISRHEIMGHMMSWKDWAFFESRRRTATAFIIINGIFHAQIVTPPPNMPEYATSPAPSPMMLWDAQNETDWATEYADHLHRNAIHGMLKNRDLVELKEAAGKQHDRWYASADSFGLLVTLAANMIACN
ncbi:hypothetical protein S40288_10050 [Stachybotrys chartarum IBT 40288]|nr:hypothetical protein S40288_10050 [Stachybotrys chartarum IBT 40288]